MARRSSSMTRDQPHGVGAAVIDELSSSSLTHESYRLSQLNARCVTAPPATNFRGSTRQTFGKALLLAEALHCRSALPLDFGRY